MASRPTSVTHARESETLSEQRVNEALLAMATGTYGDTRGARTEQRKHWAKKWKIKESTVRRYTAEAWRRMREKPELAALIYETVTEILETGEESNRLKAAKQLSDIIGLEAPKRIDAKVESSTPEERWEQLEQYLDKPPPKLQELLLRLGYERKRLVEG